MSSTTIKSSVLRSMKSKFIRELLVFWCTIILGTILEIFLVLFLPFLCLYRFTLSKLAKLFRRDLDKMVPVRSCSLGGYVDVTKTAELTIMIEIVVDHLECIDVIREKLLFQLESFWKEGKYTELKQYISTWTGFPFWKNESGFSIKDHVKYHENVCREDVETESLDYITLSRLEETLSQKPFEPQKSPWELIVLRPKYTGTQSLLVKTSSASPSFKNVMIFRIHHSLGDGMSLLGLLLSIVSSSPSETAKMTSADQRLELERPSKNEGNGFWFTFLSILGYPCWSYFTANQIARQVLENDLRHEWARKTRHELTHDFYWAHRNVSMKSLGDIKNTLLVGTHPLFLAGIAGALRSTLLRHNLQVPDNFFMGFPIPYPNHSKDQLRNEMLPCFTLLPLTIPDPIQRLRTIHSRVEELKNSAFPILLSCGDVITGMLPSFLTKFIVHKTSIPGGLTNFPGPSHSIQMLGMEPKSIRFFFGPLPAASITVCAFSYNGVISFSFGGDKAVFPERLTLENLADGVLQEFQNLKDLCV